MNLNLSSLLTSRSKSPGAPTVAQTPPKQLTALQTLLQLGLPRPRVDKALAATGARSAQAATDWLLNHVNDPLLDEDVPREYILYVCPTGALLEELQNFSGKALDQCGWNGAHSYVPHITLVSFFKAGNENVPDLDRALVNVLTSNRKDVPDRLHLVPRSSDGFVGLVLAEPQQSDFLKHLAFNFVKEISKSMINENYEPYDMISACFPWCTGSAGKFTWGLVGSHSTSPEEARSKDLHLTLAYQFQPEHAAVLSDMAKAIDCSATCVWELRLYSREARIAGNEVHRVLFDLESKDAEELDLLVGDYMYVSPDKLRASTDGWVEATSWLSGCTGFVPLHYMTRTAESDAWTLHKSLTLTKSSELDAMNDLPLPRRPPTCFSCSGTPRSPASSKSGRNKDALSDVSVAVLSNGDAEKEECQDPRKVIVARHGERVDLTFGTWVPYSFTEDGNYVRKDLNMPSELPERHGGKYGYVADAPLTQVGHLQARTTGEAMKYSGLKIQHVYVSPTLRTVQTCHNILTGMGLEKKLAMKLEPGLFEWLGWYHNGVPDLMTSEEYVAAGFNIDLDYKPFVSLNEMRDTKESCEQYYLRSTYVTQGALKTTEETGGNVLLVAHAASLDTCTRQLVGGEPRKLSDLVRVLQKVPYCSVAVAEQADTNDRPAWKLVAPNFPPMTHLKNDRFDWKVLRT